MQLESLMMMLFFTIVIPLIIMSANHNVFFILIAVILLIAAVRNIPAVISQIRGTGINEEETEDEVSTEDLIEELEDATNINIKRFSTGISLAKNLIIILFFLYCSLYLNGIIFKLLISATILYRICLTIKLKSDKKSKEKNDYTRLHVSAILLYNLLSMTIIIVSIYVKFFGSL